MDVDIFCYMFCKTLQDVTLTNPITLVNKNRESISLHFVKLLRFQPSCFSHVFLLARIKLILANTESYMYKLVSARFFTCMYHANFTEILDLRMICYGLGLRENMEAAGWLNSLSLL
jgi:hypothetical protein